MPFDTILGLPVHPLVVHAVVVLLPLAALGSIAIALRPVWRERYGTLVVVLAVLAAGAVPLATESGEQLAGRVGLPEQHQEFGDAVKFVVIPWLVLLVVLWWRTRGAGGAGPEGGLTTVLRWLVVLLAVGSIVSVVLAGHSGAVATWEKIVQNTTPAAR